MKYLKKKNLPSDLLIKIKRYLDYNFEMKRDLKIEESEVMDMMNDDLRSALILFGNGRILQSVAVLSRFPLEFLSNLSFVLEKKSFALDEEIFNEGDEGSEMYFITSGKVTLLHRESKSFIAELFKEMSFGEIAFFSDAKR